MASNNKIEASKSKMGNPSVKPPQVKKEKKGWQRVEGYSRDYLLSQIRNKGWTKDTVMAAGAKLGLKKSCMGLKMNRWVKEGKVRVEKSGVFAVI